MITSYHNFTSSQHNLYLQQTLKMPSLSSSNLYELSNISKSLAALGPLRHYSVSLGAGVLWCSWCPYNWRRRRLASRLQEQWNINYHIRRDHRAQDPARTTTSGWLGSFIQLWSDQTNTQHDPAWFHHCQVGGHLVSWRTVCAYSHQCTRQL